MKFVRDILIVTITVGLFRTSAVAGDPFRLLLAGKGADLLASSSQPTVVRKKVYPEETTENGGQSPTVVRKKVPPLPAAPEEHSTTQPPQLNAEETADDKGRSELTTAAGISPAARAEPAKAETASDAVAGESAPQPEGLESGLPRTPLTETAASPAETVPETGAAAVGAAETTPLEVFPPRPYSLMLASCRLKENAQKVVADYRKKGLSPFIVKVELGNGDVWWRISAGHYQDRQEAARAKEEHALSDSVVKKTPYSNLIAMFSSEQDARAEARRLEELGYSPYLITGEKSLRLLVGAFETRRGAEKQKAELQSEGIPSQIIER